MLQKTGDPIERTPASADPIQGLVVALSRNPALVGVVRNMLFKSLGSDPANGALVELLIRAMRKGSTSLSAESAIILLERLVEGSRR